MTTPYEDVFSEFSAEDQEWIKHRAEELKSEELGLRELRRLRKLTQSHLSKKLRIGQEGVSRIERRTDLYISTLRSYVEAVGGELVLTVRFPDRQRVILSGLGEGEDVRQPQREEPVVYANMEGTTGFVTGMSASTFSENPHAGNAPELAHGRYSLDLVK